VAKTREKPAPNSIDTNHTPRSSFREERAAGSLDRHFKGWSASRFVGRGGWEKRGLSGVSKAVCSPSKPFGMALGNPRVQAAFDTRRAIPDPSIRRAAGKNVPLAERALHARRKLPSRTQSFGERRLAGGSVSSEFFSGNSEAQGVVSGARAIQEPYRQANSTVHEKVIARNILWMSARLGGEILTTLQLPVPPLRGSAERYAIMGAAVLSRSLFGRCRSSPAPV
jgi:hypothetical protein